MNIYNNYFKKLVLAAILFIVCAEAKAQDTLTVDSNNGEFGLLNELISADTTATGERANAVYRLKRGQTYILAGPLENRGFHLNMVAEQGDGARPRLVPGLASGGDSSRPIRVRDNLTVKGLYITGLDEVGALNSDQRIVRISATGVRVVVDDCHVDQDGQSAFRVDSDDVKLYITNSIISNIGRPNNTNNGRLIDDRGSNLDTVILENNTIYNISSTLCNDRGGWIKYARVNQNTIVHTGQQIFAFGETQTGIFTNNLVINNAYLGVERDTLPFDDTYAIEFDTLSSESESELPDIAQTFTLSNNNMFLDSALIEAFPQDVENYPGAEWPVSPRPVYSPSTTAFAGESQLATNITEFVRFNNAPPVNDVALIIDQFYLDPNDNDNKSSVKNWDITGEPYNFRYQDSFESASASTSGGALGSPVWELVLSGRSGLEQSMAEAEMLIAAAVAGGNIGQYPQESIDSLNAAIAAAQLILDDASNTPDSFQSAKEELDQAIEAFKVSLITGLGFENTKGKTHIYPNPAVNYVYFTNPHAVSLEIWSISGRFVGQSKVRQNARLSVAAMRQGTYIFRIKQADGSIENVKFLKK